MYTIPPYPVAQSSPNVPPWRLPIEGNHRKYAVTHSEVSLFFFVSVYISLFISSFNFKLNLGYLFYN